MALTVMLVLHRADLNNLTTKTPSLGLGSGRLIESNPASYEN